MDSRLKPYEAYKETGFLWLDKVPKHWELKLNKYLWTERKVSNCMDEKLLSVTIKKGVISQSELLKSSSKKDSSNLDKSKYKLVMPDDIAYNKMRMWQGAVGVSKYRGIVSPAYIVLKSRMDINPRYYHYLLRTPKYIEESYRNSYGICDDQLSLRYEDFKRMTNIIPPKEEQDQIVKYLDSKLLKIKRFIKAKKKHIELLREQIEYHLYFDNTSYNSTISFWNTAFPKEWEMIKANRVFKEVKIKDCPEKELLAVTQDRGVVYKKDCEQNYVSPSENLNGLKLVRKNDYVISLRSFQGGIEFSNVEGIVSPAYNVFCFRKEFDKEDLRVYYKYLFKTKAFISLLNTMVSGIRDGKNISYTDFSQILVPLPPKRHLEKIIKLAKQYEVYKNQFENELPLLYEYRTSLISDVVTGKVDVRNIEIQDVDEQLKEGFEDTDDEIIDEEDGEIGEEV